jgi:class 3 adenylate cyclase
LKLVLVYILILLCPQLLAENTNAKSIERFLKLKNSSNKVDSILQFYQDFHVPNIDDSIESSLRYCHYAFDISNSIGYTYGIRKSGFELGYLYTLLGDYNQSIRFHFISLKSAEKALESNSNNVRDTNLLIQNLKYLGILFLMQKNYTAAYGYFSRSLLIQPNRVSNNFSIYYLLAFCELKLKKFDSVENNIQRSILGQNDSFKIYQSISLLASFYRQKGDYDSAEKLLLPSLNYFNRHTIENKNNTPRAFILEELARIKLARGLTNSAIGLATEGYKLIENDPLEFNLYELTEMLYTLHYQQGNIREAHSYLIKNKQISDSLHKKDISSTVALAFAQNDFEKKEIKFHSEIDKKYKNQLLAWGIVALSAIFFFLLIRLYRQVKKERKKSEALLLNIFPDEVSSELKLNGKVKARYHEQATILFTDFVNFSMVSEDMNPEVLVQILDEYFTEFDKLAEKYNLEKIKTIGDSYMLVGGLHSANEVYIKNTALMALDILEYVKNKNKYFEVRIGIHIGPLVSGVVGKSKFAYDVWGTSVNIAARMETTSPPQHINITEEFYDKIKSEFDCEYRGKIELKNKGLIDSYFLIKKS